MRPRDFSSFLEDTPALSVLLIMFSVIFFTQCDTSAQSRGIFDDNSDVGLATHAGSARFIHSSNEYQITGGGSNIWGEKDAFQYLWKKDSGDFSLTTRIRWIGDGKNAHRKAGWMIRQSLAPDSPYADAVIHGDGLISLQFRKAKGGPTEEIQSPISAPALLRFERHGEVFSLHVSEGGKVFHPVGSISVAMVDPVYVGLVACSHDDTTTETAIFSKVDYKSLGIYKKENRIIESSLDTISVETDQRHIVYRSGKHFEAPNYSNDGKYLLFNSEGRLYTIPVSGGKSIQLNTGFADRCNNDHGFSPDGKLLAISHHHEGKSLIYTLPSSGGTPRQVTELGPSYWHGWSPDGKTLAYCAERNGNYDIYTIPTEGGRETRLTNAEGLDDGPDYSPDGRYIYFNSERTGAMKIWRMDSDGTNQIQITNDDQYADWFPHPSGDGKQIVFLSYNKDVKGHPPNKDVALRIMSSSGDKPRILTRLFGGQGTINVPSWSPDNKHIAFVSYCLVGKDGSN
jgi:Tol biopolymer transport system component